MDTFGAFVSREYVQGVYIRFVSWFTDSVPAVNKSVYVVAIHPDTVIGSPVNNV